ncbi:hypothetical protein LAWI1_G002062 [Lachnellula willkommii]|uniref:DUF7924 domain-containing protein n=1 Tax=Lachnellula willkommii TaxID=215461 RepID=A0A559MMW2_9HELO|nr:hypothetical protein LAWI1_G002062 [Lachnellula willkommii]
MAKNILNPQGIKKQAVKAKKRTRDPENPSPIEQPTKRLRPHSPQKTYKKRKRPRENEVPPSNASLERPAKRVRTSTALVQQTIGEARIDFWTENGNWPTEEQEKSMDRFRDIVNHARAKRRSLSRKRSNASLNTETAQTQTQSSQQPRDQKSAPYKHPMFEEQLKECGSFMDDYDKGITAESERLCQTLLQAPQPLPEHTLFSDDELFKKTCKRIRGENETKVVRDIAQLIVPPAEILADRGAEHLEILRETTNACWVNSYTFINPSGSRPGPRPQPDFGLGFKRDAFSREQLQKLQIYIGDPLADSSWIAATYNMYLPFLSSEVKCGAAGLDIADRQNAHTQSVILRGLYTLFRLVGRENELHRKINGFSISHSDVEVRIWGHYAIINGKDVEFYRHSIAEFSISPTARGDERWTAYSFVKNVYDLWLPEHYKRICSVIDMLPADLNFDVSELDQELNSSRSGLSQGFDDYSLADEQVVPDSQPSVQQMTPATTIQTKSSNLKKKKTK